jgi:hypothetical protein
MTLCNYFVDNERESTHDSALGVNRLCLFQLWSEETFHSAMPYHPTNWPVLFLISLRLIRTE